MIERPSFLAEHVTPAKEVGSGDFVDVVELASVSKEVAEQVPTGFVLKRYKFSEHDSMWFDLFRGDDEINVYTSRIPRQLEVLKKHGKKRLHAGAVADTIRRTLDSNHRRYAKEYRSDQERNPEEYAQREDCERRMTNPSDAAKLMEAWSLPSIAKRLRERHESLKIFFATHGLPDLVVPTNFVVGRGKGPYITEEGEYIYEVQPKVDPVAIPEHIVQRAGAVYQGGYGNFLSFDPFSEKEQQHFFGKTSKELAEFLKKNLTSDLLQTVQRELALLYPIAETLPREIGRVPPDIFNVKNLVITKEGLRIIDTNQSVPFLEDDALQRIVAIEKENRSDDQYAILEQHARYKRSVAFLKQVSEQLKEK